NDNSASPPLSRLLNPSSSSFSLPFRSSSFIHSTIPRTVARSKISRSGTSTPYRFFTRVTTCVASSECPPSSKKFSPTPTPLTFSTSSHILATSSSIAPPFSSGLSSRRSCCRPSRSRFSRPLSTLPLLVSGSSSTSSTAHGTMYSGNSSRTPAFTSSPLPLPAVPLSALLTTYPPIPSSPRSSSSPP